MKIIQEKYPEYSNSISKYLDNNNEIYLCEGYCSGDRDCMKPHYKTMFALAHDPEHMTVGEFFTTEIVFPFMSKDDRLKSAELRAKEFADAMRKVNAK